MMSQFEFVSCRLSIQICIGHFPDGRERHRTFSVKNIKPDADEAALLTAVRAIGSLLAYPVTRARLIVKKRRVLFDVKRGTDAIAVPLEVSSACIRKISDSHNMNNMVTAYYRRGCYKENAAPGTCAPKTRGAASVRAQERGSLPGLAAQAESVFAKSPEPANLAAGARRFFKTFLAAFRSSCKKLSIMSYGAAL
jgi:hypothetical protein